MSRWTISFCENCESVYIEDQDEEDDKPSSLLQKDDEYFPSEGSDEDVDGIAEESDGREHEEDKEDTTDDDKDEFVLLPPRDNVCLPSEESDRDQDEQSEALDRRNVFSDSDDSDTHAESTAKSTSKSKTKLKEKKPAKPKRTTTKTAKRNPKTTPKVSTKLPSIFSDAILPNAKPQKNDTSNIDELAFSDLSDEEGVNDSEYTPIGQQSKARKKRRAKKQVDTSDSDTDDEEEEDEVIMVFKRGNKDSLATKEYTRNNLKAATPLKQYSTFAQFNKEMRGKLAKEHKKALDLSGEPQAQLSRLVADAWKALPKVTMSLPRKRGIY